MLRLRWDPFLELRLPGTKDTVGHDVSMDGIGYRWFDETKIVNFD